MANAGQLSSMDAAFLYYERPVQRLHVGSVSLLDGPVPYDAFTELTVQRLAALPRYSQRPVRPVLDWALPRWQDVPRFDPRHHIRHVGVPPPGGDAELHALVDELMATPLDPESPLWETYLIDGLADGGAAILNKVHHCMIDGVSGVQLLEVLTDPGTEPASAPPTPSPMLRTHGSGGARPWSARAAVEAVTTLARWVIEPSSRLPFNGPISADRRLRWTTLSLERLLAVRGAVGCKLNDVILSVIAGGLRRWLVAHSFGTDGLCVRAMVPVSMRTAGDHLTLGNLVSAMFPVLPVDIADPLDRLHKVAAHMSDLKERGQAHATGLLMTLAGALPAPVSALLGRMLPSWPMINVVCTNVPGPREPRYVLGRRIVGIHPIVPLFEGLGLGFAILSYAEQISIAAAADPAQVGDVEAITDAIATEFEALVAALGLEAPVAAVAAAAPAMAVKVADLMTAKVQTISPGTSLGDAWGLMRRSRIRHLPVVDDIGRLIGLVTQRDLLGAAPSMVGEADETVRLRRLGWLSAHDVMETHLVVVAPNEPAASAGQRMLAAKIGCLPVVDDTGELAGIVTEEDFLRWATLQMAPAVREFHAA
jgi:diacylglycerol O-acyltransferase / wax synthase